MSNQNKALWDRVCVTDPRAVKPITGKQYSGNSPKPYWIVERLTDEFGPCGIGWGFEILSERMERLSEHDILHVAQVRMWYMLEDKRGNIEQVGQTKAAYMSSKDRLIVDEDAPKKSVTDALVKCASYIGFAGDIFAGRWDDSKYVEGANQAWREKEQVEAQERFEKERSAWIEKTTMELESCETAKELQESWKKAFATMKDNKDEEALQSLTIIKDRMKALIQEASKKEEE